ncbi:MAG: hypothetical protein D6785_07720 [Planctomycetota bacterium]|nr:MAG: hypothetical protein D6785_07720 [Planctomycetota bacterium]
MKKRFYQFIALFLVFIPLLLGGRCEDLGGNPFEPVDPLFQRIVTVGDSITEGVMSGDANFQTQPYAYPVLLARQANTEMPVPLMVAESSGYHRTIPGLYAYNIGVSGMDVALTSILTTKKTVADWKRTTNFTSFVSDSSFSFTDELDAVLSPQPVGTNSLDVAKNLGPTFIVFWLGNNDALGSVAGTGRLDPNDSSKYASGLPQNLSGITESGLNYQTHFIDGVIKPLSTQLAAAIFAAQLDDNDPRGSGLGYRPVERMAQTGAPHNFQSKYRAALDALMAISTNPKVVVLNIPDVTAIASLFSFSEAKQFFITYGGATQAELDQAWGTTGFGGDASAKVPLEIMILGLNIYKNLKGSLGSAVALRYVSQGAAIGTNTGFTYIGTSQNQNVSLFDWDVNNIVTSELNTLQAVLGALNTAIQTEVNNVAAANPGRITLKDINAFFNTVKTNGYEIKDPAGNVVAKLSRVYPGAGDPNSNDGSKTNGGIFTLDGIHPTPTAHAIITNQIIDQSNKDFNTSLPKVDEYSAWLMDPMVDHDKDGYIVGFSFTRSSTSIGEKVILRDPNDGDPNSKPSIP